MQETPINSPAFVVKANELAALTYLASGHPSPHATEWINRGTDQKLRRTTVDMLMRTLFDDAASPSVERLHQSAGLRLVFNSECDRAAFATAFAAARTQESIENPNLLTAIFDKITAAEAAVPLLLDAGVNESSILLLRRANGQMAPKMDDRAGHSKLSVTLATAGGGIVGTMMGVAILAIPAIGPVLATSTLISSVATVGGIAGAAGGAIARMLTDLDVDSTEAAHIGNQIRHGKVFMSVDMRLGRADRATVRRLLSRHGGRLLSRAPSERASIDAHTVASTILRLGPAVPRKGRVPAG